MKTPESEKIIMAPYLLWNSLSKIRNPDHLPDRLPMGLPNVPTHKFQASQLPLSLKTPLMVGFLKMDWFPSMFLGTSPSLLPNIPYTALVKLIAHLDNQPACAMLTSVSSTFRAFSQILETQSENLWGVFVVLATKYRSRI